MMLSVKKALVDKIWQVIVDTYGIDEDTQYFLLDMQKEGILKWALRKTENLESDLAFMKHAKGMPIYDETIRDATLMRRVLELVVKGEEKGPYLGPGDPRLRYGSADVSECFCCGGSIARFKDSWAVCRDCGRIYRGVGIE